MNTLRNHIRKILSESYGDSVLEAKMPLRRVAGALIKDVTTDKVLLLKRNDKTPKWAMMSGEIDEGEDVLDGLEREMYEELFIRPGSVRLNFMGVEHIPAKNIDLYYFEGFVKNQFKPHLDEENLDYGWFSLEDLPSPLLGGLYNKVSHILDKNNVYSDVKVVSEKEIISEYITNDEVYLKDYFSQSKEQKKYYLPHEYYYFFQDFLDETDTYFERPKEEFINAYNELEFGEDYNDIELMTWLENNNKEIYNKFADYLFDKISNNTLPINDSDYPAWSYFDDSPSVVKNQWLIHFTDDAEGISSNGFKYGVDDMTKLGLTTHLGEFDKKYGGYNFAYLLSDFPRYARGGHRGTGYKYGKEAVVFRASGIKLWHYGDEEPQVIFYGNTANNFIPITEGDRDRWAIRAKNGKILFENDELERVVLWLTKNYEQYRKKLNESGIKDKKQIFENLQLADKVYFNTKKLSPKVREIITTKITNGDAWTKLITDIYWAILQQSLRQSEWIMHTIENPGADLPEKKDEYETEDDVLNIEDWKKIKSYYQQLKSYNKNLFPIKGLNPNGVEDILSVIRALDQRATILREIQKLPSIALRNMREDIRVPRDGSDMNNYRHYLEHFLAHYSLLGNRDAELKKFVEKKMFKSGMTLDKLLSFVEEKENLLGGKKFDKEVVKDIIENNDYGELEIIYEQGDIMVVEVSGPYGIKEIGCNSLWCFTYGDGYSRHWNQYSYNGTVYVIIDFSEPSDSREFMNVVIKPIVWNPKDDEEEINDETIFDMSNQNRYDAISYLSSTMGLDNAKKLLTFYVEPDEEEEYNDEDEEMKEPISQKNPNQLSLFEARKQVRLIIEQKILSEHYLNEAIEILMEAADQPSPTFTWDVSGENQPIEEPSPTFTWDLAKEKVDLSKRYVKTKEQAVEYLKKFFDKIKGLPKDLKIKLAKYVVSSFVGLVGIGIISGLMSNAVPEIEKEVVKVVADKVVVDKVVRTQHKEYKRPTQVSKELLDFLKHEEGSIAQKGEPVLKAYKLGDGAVTVGWGHAERISDTKLRPGQTITRAQAEAYFQEDVAEAKSYVDDMLNDWEKEGISPKITQSMYDAMVSMVYNMGIGTFRFSERSASLIDYLKSGQFDKAQEEIKKVSSHLYKRFPGLEKRRNIEAEIFGFDLGLDVDQGSKKLAMN